jgi:hypothetical protein
VIAECPDTPISASGVVMTNREQELFAELQSETLQSASCPDQCREILKTEPWCSVTLSVKQITHPEWDELFPETDFYLEEYDTYGGDDPPVVTYYRLIVEQGGQQYGKWNYDQLLAANRIEITDDNRELVARAFALMTISDYLSEEVIFEAWTPNLEPDYKAYDAYDMKAWTRFGGMEIGWLFMFDYYDCPLFMFGPSTLQYRVGDYVKTPLLGNSSYWPERFCVAK